jgi:hypothetical protein
MQCKLTDRESAEAWSDKRVPYFCRKVSNEATSGSSKWQAGMGAFSNFLGTFGIADSVQCQRG